MSGRPDEPDSLAGLLRMLPAPEPSAGFRAAARRRYLDELEARARREVLTGLVAALIGLAVIAAVVGTLSGPAGLVAWLAEVAADLARWTTAVGVIVALVPEVVWAPLLLGAGACVLLVARARSLAVAK